MLAADLKTPKRQADHPSGDARFDYIDRVMKRNHYQQHALIEVLHTAQEVFGYLEEDLLIYVANHLKLPPSWVYGVATFYHFFSLEPQGEHTCIVCMGTACYVKRSAAIVAALQKEFRVEPGEAISDGKLSLAMARCLGSCGLAPAVVLDGEVLGLATPETTLVRVRRSLEGSQTELSHGPQLIGGERSP